MKKMETEKILEKLKHLNDFYKFESFINSLDLTPEQFKILSKHKIKTVRRIIAQRSDLPVDLLIKLSEDKYWAIRKAVVQHPKLTEKLMYKLVNDKSEFVRGGIIRRPEIPVSLLIRLNCDVDYWLWSVGTGEKFKKVSSIKLEDLESAYDLINNSKHIDRENFKETFDYIADEFPELKKTAKMFKTIILKGKKDFK